jgi:flagellar biosynthesis protein
MSNITEAADTPGESQDTAISKPRQGDQIMKIARQHRVQIRQDCALLETLAHFNVTEAIPPELYGAVAEVLTFLHRIETAKQ